jgi:hypothetical protein
MRWLALVVLVMMACAPRATQPPDPSQMRYPGEFAAARSWRARDFHDAAGAGRRYGEREFHGEVVVQKVGDKLTLIGVTPFGTKAFVVQQDASGVKGQEIIKGTLPFPPEFMLLDVHRSLFMGLAEGTGDGTASAAGARRGRRSRRDVAGRAAAAAHVQAARPAAEGDDHGRVRRRDGGRAARRR